MLLHALVGFAIATGVTVPVTRYLMWRAWLKFNLKIIESQSDPVDTSKIAESFLNPIFMHARRLESPSTRRARALLERRSGDQSQPPETR